MSDKESSPEPSSSDQQQEQSSSGPAKKIDLAAYRERFNNLHKKREEGRKANHVQVVEEDRVSKLPRNFEAKRKRQEWELEEIEGRNKAEEKGEDYDRNKCLNVQADIAEKVQAAKRRKKRPDPGFASYEQMSIRQYERLTSSYKPDMKAYGQMKEVIGEEEFYPDSNTLMQGTHYPTDAAMDRLTTDIKAQEKRRQNFHRRRVFDAESKIDYINEKNRKFNEKLERYYGDYTQDLKQDLERGTAL